MLSYQHAYHAGGPADLHKHAALAWLLERLTVKPRPISYLESHAGRGLYDLADAASAKTGEAAAGIARVRPQGRYADALETVRAAYGPTAYPGSPLIADALLRPVDRITLCELHPQEHAALRQVAPEGTAVHHRDGHEGLIALTPPKPRRGLALIDPSYEVKDEYARTAQTALDLIKRWPEGVVMIWYPILPDRRHLALTEPLGALPAQLLSETWFTEPPERGMQGSGLAVLNPPYGLEKALASLWPAYAQVLRPV
ncbi:MAG: 23S rRNA (adenine(2030)-N(6))-methyltransferase RlmJ [Pseudomonadota bacterium]